MAGKAAQGIKNAQEHRELARWLRAASLPVPRDPAAAMRAWLDWLMVQRGETAPAAADKLAVKWHARLRQAGSKGDYPATADLAFARECNLLGLALGAGGSANLARLAGRTRFYYGRVVDGQRRMGTRGARDLEAALGLPVGWLDEAGRTLEESITTGARISRDNAPALAQTHNKQASR